MVRNTLVIVVIALVVAVAGLTLAVAPLTAVRAANTLRFVPYSKSNEAVRFYRASGVAMVVLGLIAGVLMA